MRRTPASNTSATQRPPVVAILILILLGLAGRPAPSAGQVVTGRLLDSSTREPIVLGTVALLDTTLTVVDETFTNEKGQFRLASRTAGSFYVVARRLGYNGSIDGILDIREGGAIDVEFYLRPQPLVLEGLNVAARRQHQELLERNGFYDRRNMGFGHFITPEDIERRPPFDEADLFRRVPFVGVESGFGGTSINVLSRGQRCTPAFFVDGVRVTFPPGQDGIISSVIDVEEIIAAEVFRGAAEIPAQYGAFNTCGVILIWTWRGDD